MIVFQLVLNAALGFDSYLVMRHGYTGPSNNPEQTATASVAAASSSVTKLVEGSQLGCYFCSDVVAPGNVSRYLYQNPDTMM